jgi:hypothetical protein
MIFPSSRRLGRKPCRTRGCAKGAWRAADSRRLAGLLELITGGGAGTCAPGPLGTSTLRGARLREFPEAGSL